MSKFPVLPLFTDAFLADTTHLTAQETGAYALLLIIAWRMPECRLPDDDTKLAKWARVDLRTWKRIKPRVMLEFWELRSSYWSQKRLTKERSNVSKRAEVAQQNGLHGGRPKSLKSHDAPNPTANPDKTQTKPSISISLEGGDGGGSARAREARPLISPEAFAFSDELAKLCGQDLKFLTPQWVSAQPAMRVQMMLDAGWNLDAMRETAKAIVHRRKDRGEDPPESIRYFEKAFARAQAPQLPIPTVQIVKESPHAQTVSDGDRRTPWQRDRDANRAAREALRASVERDQSGESGGEPHLRVVPDANRR